MVYLSVCVSADHNRDPRKNGKAHRGAAWCVESCPQGTTYQMETQILMEGTVLRGVDLLKNQSGLPGAARGDAASRYR